MDFDITDRHETEKQRKPYHAPEFITLGPIQSVLGASMPPGADIGGMAPCTGSKTVS
jgi:hypothetical protein